MPSRRSWKEGLVHSGGYLRISGPMEVGYDSIPGVTIPQTVNSASDIYFRGDSYAIFPVGAPSPLDPEEEFFTEDNFPDLCMDLCHHVQPDVQYSTGIIVEVEYFREEFWRYSSSWPLLTIANPEGREEGEEPNWDRIDFELSRWYKDDKDFWAVIGCTCHNGASCVIDGSREAHESVFDWAYSGCRDDDQETCDSDYWQYSVVTELEGAPDLSDVPLCGKLPLASPGTKLDLHDVEPISHDDDHHDYDDEEMIINIYPEDDYWDQPDAYCPDDEYNSFWEQGESSDPDCWEEEGWEIIVHEEEEGDVENQPEKGDDQNNSKDDDWKDNVVNGDDDGNVEGSSSQGKPVLARMIRLAVYPTTGAFVAVTLLVTVMRCLPTYKFVTRVGFGGYVSLLFCSLDWTLDLLTAAEYSEAGQGGLAVLSLLFIAANVFVNVLGLGYIVSYEKRRGNVGELYDTNNMYVAAIQLVALTNLAVIKFLPFDHLDFHEYPSGRSYAIAGLLPLVFENCAQLAIQCLFLVAVGVDDVDIIVMTSMGLTVVSILFFCLLKMNTSFVGNNQVHAVAGSNREPNTMQVKDDKEAAQRGSKAGVAGGALVTGVVATAAMGG